ncbi:MAG TPA: hypothetical protein VK907_11280 [Phnomibacter sp.]|nr:hypothetical protein [Phnomibacter sp.]
MDFLRSLSVRNPVLYYGGLVSFFCAVVFIFIALVDHRQVLGVNAFIKPIKFFLSIGIFCWTMAWYLTLLAGQRATAIRWYSWMVVIVFTIEMLVIAMQPFRGQLSHFNVSTPLNGMLFSLMGIAIVTLTTWTLVTGIWFWRSPAPEGYPAGFWWGIRLGIVLFVIFSFEGMIMAQRLQHTVGAPDGGDGLPLLNWSKQHGDLRVAHFVGIHALQVLPLLGHFLLKRPAHILLGALVYASFAAWLFLRAMAGTPLV